MQALTYFLPQARNLIRPIWSTDGTKMASLAVKWLYSELGATAYVWWVEQMMAAKWNKEEWRAQLATEVFRLQVEIAARREGWCPELESPGRDDEEREYFRLAHAEVC